MKCAFRHPLESRPNFLVESTNKLLITKENLLRLPFRLSYRETRRNFAGKLSKNKNYPYLDSFNSTNSALIDDCNAETSEESKCYLACLNVLTESLLFVFILYIIIKFGLLSSIYLLHREIHAYTFYKGLTRNCR
jgi:hypothetical protein